MSKPRQHHGIEFEQAIEPAFPGFVRSQQSPTAQMDIPAEFDTAVPQLPTSVKTTQSGRVCLADAQRFLQQEGPYRILVGRHERRGDDRYVYQVREYHMDAEAHQRLCAGVRPEDVAQVTAAIKQCGNGQHHQARAVARSAKPRWQGARLSINPKIDHLTQRRVQCSVSLATLDEVAGRCTVHETEYRSVALPLQLGGEEGARG